MKKNTKKVPVRQSDAKVEKKSPAVFGLRPLGDRVIVKELDINQKEVTDSGIYIPQSTELEKGAKRGTVLAVGPGKFEEGKLTPMNITVGDTIIFQWGDTVMFQGEEYYILKEQEIAAVILT